MAGSSYATASRRKILEYLKNSNDHTVTAADVDEYLKKHDSEVNITTIYRYLDKLAKDGTVIKYVAEKGCQAAYQYVEQGKCVVDLYTCEPAGDKDLPILLIRRLTPLECERLQGFPDGWTDIPGASDSARYKALGNSVAIPCVDFVMKCMADAIRGSD